MRVPSRAGLHRFRGAPETPFDTVPEARPRGGGMRWVVDRRAQPSENNGTLTIAGERGEVLKAAVEHAVPSRGHTDSEELRSAIESARARAAAAG